MNKALIHYVLINMINTVIKGSNLCSMRPDGRQQTTKVIATLLQPVILADINDLSVSRMNFEVTEEQE